MKKTDIPAPDFPSMEFVTEDFDLFFVIKEIKAQISNSLKGNRRNALWIFLPFLLLLPLLHSCFLNKVTKYEYSDTMIITEKFTKIIPAHEDYFGLAGGSVKFSLIGVLNITKTIYPEKKLYYIKTSRDYTVYEEDIQTKQKKIISKQKKVKKYEVTEKVFNSYKIGMELIFSSENQTWCIKPLLNKE